MTPELADKIMTRIIARIEADGGVLHKSSGIEEIIGACAVADAEGEIVESISDIQDGVWRRKDGTPFEAASKMAPTSGKYYHEITCLGAWFAAQRQGTR